MVNVSGGSAVNLGLCVHPGAAFPATHSRVEAQAREVDEEGLRVPHHQVRGRQESELAPEEHEED